MKRLCCFFNYNPLYRYPIYHAMDEAFECDFFFGDSVFQPLKQFPPGQLKGFRKTFRTVNSGFKNYKWHKGILPLFKGYSSYLVTGQIDYLAYWLLIVFCKLTNKKIYCWTHGIPYEEFQKPVSRTIFRLFFKGMDGIFMYNHYKCTLMNELGISSRRLHVIHNSMDTATQTRLFQEMKPSPIYHNHFGNPRPTIIYIGRIQAYKRLDLLIDALQLINKGEHRANLVIVGAPTDNFTLEDKIASCGQTAHVWLYGPCFDEDRNGELLYNASVCVCPEAIGLTAIHSLSYGTPVVTNDSFETQGPEFESIEEGVTGSFYKSGSVEALADALLKWISRTPGERDQTRKAARQNVTDSWSVDYQMEVLRNVFPDYIKQD